ncbi:MAG: tRNA (adenosine(37)-N6)-threonylcarbamoyltransferase complex transferase subunit TsaD, partial [Phycisphaerae bacterium]|nr:tRNA (adenosine(37)-N6)-threonylcarbamoyltransferase complex transferase subunit TsaD [Phycisphaerae bacterium]
TSCDETAAAITDDGSVVHSSVVASQTDIHARYAGVVPELASRAHVERITPVIREALADARTPWNKIDAVAVGHRPGLIGSLLVGVSAAKALAWSLGVPLIGVDHVHAHLHAASLTQPGDPSPPPSHTDHFPALGLVISGGHTSLYLVDSPTAITRLGATIDDALGEAYDKAAAILGIPFPGGPNLDRLAASDDADDRAADLPVSRLGPDSLDFSFSGLKTSLLYAARGIPSSPTQRLPHPAPPPLTPERVRDLAASFQRAAVRAVIFKIERALDAADAGDLGHNARRLARLIVGGGVASNSRLRRELADLAARRTIALHIPQPRYCIDNAAMIAGLAFHLHADGVIADLSLQAHPSATC